MLSICLIYNKSNTFGIRKDVAILREVLGGKGYTLKEADPLEPPSACDFAIHLEVPSYVWMAWAQKNILVVNPEWYVSEAWDAYLPKFDAVICKDMITEMYFSGKEMAITNTGWALPPAKPAKKKDKTVCADEFVWFLAASNNKRAMVPAVIAAWKDTYPRLTIFTTAPLADTGPWPEHIQLVVKDLEPSERELVARSYKGHLAISRAEGFGYTAAEARQTGAFLIVSSLPCYKDMYANDAGSYVVDMPMERKDMAQVVDTDACTPEILQAGFDEAISRFAAWTPSAPGPNAWYAFEDKFLAVVHGLQKGLPPKAPRLPPLLNQADCPPISVVTLLYNRRKFFDLACHNIMISDYPKDKVEWIIVEDSDDPAESSADMVKAVAAKSDPLKVVYVPLKSRAPVGEKRNIGAATASHDIILMMDDDDHYPETSFRRRVAWLTGHSWKPSIVGCTTIACYDLLKGISAVNSPPNLIPLGQRVSEATLAFYKSWWEQNRFDSAVQIGEGESFLTGREGQFLELAPQQIIVAFSHNKNASGRRIPSDEGVKPGCFWGFPPEYLEFIHGLAGVKIVRESKNSS
jgi:hypothetical protein